MGKSLKTCLISIFIFCAGSVLGADSGSQTMGSVKGKSVNIVQQGSSKQKVENIAGGNICLKQTSDDGPEINLCFSDTFDEDTLNGSFSGSDIDRPEFSLRTTMDSVVYRGKKYSYDGVSKCAIENGKLVMCNTYVPNTDDGNTQYFMTPVKTVLLGGAIVTVSVGVALGVCYYLSSDTE